MSENNSNENNEKDINDIINSGYIDDLRKKYEAAETEPADFENPAAETSPGIFHVLKNNRLRRNKDRQPEEEATIKPSQNEDENAVNPDKNTTPGNANIPGAEELYAYFAEISSELEAAKNEITRPISEDAEDEAISYESSGILLESNIVSNTVPDDIPAEQPEDNDGGTNPEELSKVPEEVNAESESLQEEIPSEQTQDNIDNMNFGEPSELIEAAADDTSEVQIESPETSNGFESEPDLIQDEIPSTKSENKVEEKSTEEFCEIREDSTIVSDAVRDDFHNSQPEENEDKINPEEAPLIIEAISTEPVAVQDETPAPVNPLPAVPQEVKPSEAGPLMPSMRIIYQAPDGKNPGFIAPQYPVMQPAYPDYNPAAEPIPFKQETPRAVTGHDYLSNMRVIYEAPEEIFKGESENNTITIDTAETGSHSENEPSAGSAGMNIGPKTSPSSEQIAVEPASLQPEEAVPPSDSIADLFADIPEEEPGADKKGIKKLVKSIFPCKGDGLGESIRKVVLMISVITMIVCGGILLNTYILAPSQSHQQEQKAIDVKTNSSKTKNWAAAKDKYANVNFPKGMQLKYADLFVINKDFAGWLEIKGAGIDMPVVKAKDNEVYLKKTFYGEHSKYGCIFADFRNELSALNRNTILYGHNMSYDDLMFGKLEIYRNIDSFKAAPLIEFNTLYNDYKWKIYAVLITNSRKQDDNNYVFDYIFTELGSDASFQSYIDAVDQRKLYTTGVDILPTDKILTLSTCCYDFDDARFVVIARMVRKGESESVDVSKASVNSNPRYPQAWYSSKGKSNPYSNAEKWIPS